jgi:transposase
MVKKQSSTDLKLKAVKYYRKINNYAEVCRIFGCSERSLKRWIERYKQTNDITRIPRKQGSYKIKKEHINYIKEILKSKNNIHIKSVHDLLKIKFPSLSISRQYLHDIIRDNNITRKRATFEHFPKTYRGKPRNEKEELKEFFKEVSKFKLDDIVSIDETSVSTSLGFNYCRNYLGKRCIIKTDDNAVFTKYSLVVAISNKKCLGYALYDKGSVNSTRFNEFIKLICDKSKNKLIILDNGQIHKKDETVKIIKDSGNNLLYTCPYHPRLNCIEQFFNQMKYYMKLYESKNYDELKENLKKSIKNIKEENYKNYFIYAYNKEYYKSKKDSKKKSSSKYRKLKIYKE